MCCFASLQRFVSSLKRSKYVGNCQIVRFPVRFLFRWRAVWLGYLGCLHSQFQAISCASCGVFSQSFSYLHAQVGLLACGECRLLSLNWQHYSTPSSANFPIICITLRENLRTLLHKFGPETHSEASSNENTESAFGSFVSRHSYALLAIVPPFIIAFFTEDVSMLVGFTGAYAGLGIQVRFHYFWCWVVVFVGLVLNAWLCVPSLCSGLFLLHSCTVCVVA